MRRICINAVQSMKAIHSGLTAAPAVDGRRTVGKGGQVDIHSSVRGVQPGGLRSWAVLHPRLKARIEEAGSAHHFSAYVC